MGCVQVWSWQAPVISLPPSSCPGRRKPLSGLFCQFGAGGMGQRLAAKGVRSCRSGLEVSEVGFIFNGKQILCNLHFPDWWQYCPCGGRVLNNAYVYILSPVAMESIRIDGFHGDYLKISFFEGLDIAAEFTECSGCHWGPW